MDIKGKREKIILVDCDHRPRWWIMSGILCDLLIFVENKIISK